MVAGIVAPRVVEYPDRDSRPHPRRRRILADGPDQGAAAASRRATFLSRLDSTLRAAGIDDIVAVIAHDADAIEAAASTARLDCASFAIPTRRAASSRRCSRARRTLRWSRSSSHPSTCRSSRRRPSAASWMPGRRPRAHRPARTRRTARPPGVFASSILQELRGDRSRGRREAGDPSPSQRDPQRAGGRRRRIRGHRYARGLRTARRVQLVMRTRSATARGQARRSLSATGRSFDSTVRLG